MTALLKSRLLWSGVLGAALLGLYALLGFVAAPKLIRSQAAQYVRETYGRELQLGEIKVNPFKLQLEIRDIALPDADRAPMLGLRRLFIDFELASLWHRAYTFKNVDLEGLAIRAVIRPDGALNLAHLSLPESGPAAPAEPDAPLPSVWIQSLVVREGGADYIDQSRAKLLAQRFEPIAFNLQDFRTTPAGGDFAFSARGQRVDELTWRGRMALAPRVSSQGEFAISNANIPLLAEFAGDSLPFGLTSGLLNLAGSYEFTAGAATVIRAVLPRVEVTGLGLRARGLDSDWITVPAVVVSDTHIALPARTVAIGRVTVSDVEAVAWLNADGSTNIDQLLGSTPASAPASPPVAANNANSTPAQPWQVNVAALDVRNAGIDFEDRSLQPAAKFALAPLNVGIKDVTLDLARQLPVQFDASINGKAALAGTGTLVPQPLSAAIDMRLDALDLADLQPYVAAATDMTIKAGTLTLSGKLGMAPPGGDAPEMSFAGDVKVMGFRSIDNALEQDFFLFDTLELSRLRYASLPDSLTIDRVRVVKPFNKVIISSDQVVNVAAVFDPAGTAATVQANRAAAAAVRAAPARKKTRAELKAERAAEQAAAKARAHARPPPPPDLKETGMPIRIRELLVENGRMDFADFSIQPNFAADISGLNGTVAGMSTDPKARAKVELKGRVGEFSPVTIAGDVQPFAYASHTNIGLKFENISLPIFNPYSGKFAGYSIAKGKLTTDLHYAIDDRKLAATHKIRIDQLDWGDATAQKTEASLPVKFATSLLKDVDGVITLDIPVNGTIDDPEFRVGPIIWQVIRNILTKAVTAPFRALGALFKDAEEAQFVDFAPGQATLDAPTSERLAGLARALVPKADIRLSVPIGTWAELDRAALAQQHYDAELQAALLRTLHGKKDAPGAALPAFDTLDADKKIKALTELVTHVTGTAPKMPEPGERPEGTSRKEARAAADAAAIDYLQAQARAQVAPSELEIGTLGQQRAEAVQKALLTDTGLEPQRVFMVKDGKISPQGGKVRFELAME